MSNDRKLEEARNALNDARVFVAGIDRSVLGRFAVVSDEALAVAISLNTLRNIINKHNDSNEVRTFLTRNKDYLFDQLMNNETDGYYDAVAEASYWDGTKYAVTSFDQSFLQLAASVPTSYHDYLAVGMRDIELIAYCVENDVDPQLALSLDGVPA